MGLLLDIVPNHTAASSDNPWWVDVLENGPSSIYAHYFDIDWHPATTKAAFLQENRVLLPVLGDLYSYVLERHELKLLLEESGIYVTYYDWKLLVDPKTYSVILEPALERARRELGSDHEGVAELVGLLEEVLRLPPRDVSDAQLVEIRRQWSQAIKDRLWYVYLNFPQIKQVIDDTLRSLEGRPGEQTSFDSLDKLLSLQAYRLAFWKITAEEINYRRFFDISDLVGLRVELRDVFEARHAQIFELVESGTVTALRIDHVDGLYDPTQYLRWLQERFSGKERPSRQEQFYIVTEKILGSEEELPVGWPVAGTTGYDFLNALNYLYISADGYRTLLEAYEIFTRRAESFEEVCYQAKRFVMRELFAGEVTSLTHHLARLAAADRHARDVPVSDLRRALEEVTACLPVYRTYVRDFSIEERDRRYIELAVEKALQRVDPKEVSSHAFEFPKCVMLLKPPYYAEEQKGEWLRFVMRWQQFTGPVMAKGLEDTAFYRHNALLSLNEVGADPLRHRLPFGVEAFHQFN